MGENVTRLIQIHDESRLSHVTRVFQTVGCRVVLHILLCFFLLVNRNFCDSVTQMCLPFYRAMLAQSAVMR